MVSKQHESTKQVQLQNVHFAHQPLGTWEHKKRKVLLPAQGMLQLKHRRQTHERSPVIVCSEPCAHEASMEEGVIKQRMGRSPGRTEGRGHLNPWVEKRRKGSLDSGEGCGVCAMSGGQAASHYSWGA